MKKGVSLEKIKPLGIPFDPKFNQPVSREEIIQRYKLDARLPNILIMGGGQGLGPIKTMVNSLEKAKNDFQEIIVTGTNKKVYKSLKKKIRKLKKKALLFGYANNIHELMSISDLIITKPGGVTTAEALAKNLPMIIVKPIPGQEASNAAYLTEENAALRIDRAKDIGILIEDLLSNRNKLNRLRESAQRISKPRASSDIAQLLLNLSGKDA